MVAWSVLMGVRRDRPSHETGPGSVSLRLRDGSMVSVSVDQLRRDAEDVTGGICCFCGEEVDYSDPRHVTVAVHWSDEEKGQTQSWSAHDTCLAEHMHDRVKGTGVFPDR